MTFNSARVPQMADVCRATSPSSGIGVWSVCSVEEHNTKIQGQKARLARDRAVRRGKTNEE